MDYHKIHHPLNFSFADRGGTNALHIGDESFPCTLTDHGSDILHLDIAGRWGARDSEAVLTPPDGTISGQTSLSFDRDATFTLTYRGTPVLRGRDGASFGVCGEAWMLEFDYDPAMRFYGFGEKTGRLEKTGARTKFWNTDVFADFHRAQIEAAQTDPMYVSIPWILLRTPEAWIGILIDNPHVPFVSAGGRIGAIANQKDIATRARFYLGADGGAPDLWFLVAEDLATLTARYQRLVGVTPLPPLWALGHQQCRWGYASFDDLRDVQAQLARYGIPTSGLWLDIEYMDGYRVFTWDPALWGDVPAQLADLQRDGQRVVPILDPGVKVDPGYPVYESGLAAGAFCLTHEKKPFTGFVWPGETLFPDYIDPDGAAWWAEQVTGFARHGIRGAWLDMNDPAVGPVELENMRFRKGTLPHRAGHSQYGYGMARATHRGFTAAHPDIRPFLLARSGWISCQRVTALWTGDNLSSETYMRGSIPCTLNLALSGVPLNGPDVPGFGDDADERLAVRWYQLGFLFPFLRNHCIRGARGQEPYAFSRETREILTHLIRLRHRLLPYLYQLWIDQEEEGTAVMRPLVYAYDACAGVPLDSVDDQFLIGAELMQAPLTRLEGSTRRVFLPGGDWFDLRTGVWVEGDVIQEVTLGDADTPLYARAGSVIPMAPAEPTDHHTDLADVDLHCFLREGDAVRVRYRADDGETTHYRKGVRSEVVLDLSVRGGRVQAAVVSVSEGWKPLAVRLVVYGDVRGVSAGGADLPMEAMTWRATGTKLACRRSGALPSSS